MIRCNRGIVEIYYVYELYPEIYLSCKVGYAHYKGLYGLIYINAILISANCFAHVSSRQVVKGAVWYASYYTCKQWYNEIQDKTEIYVRIIDNIRSSMLLISTEGS